MKVLKSTWYPAEPLFNLYPKVKRIRRFVLAGIICLVAIISTAAVISGHYFPEILSEYLLKVLVIGGISVFLYPLLFPFAGREDLLIVFDKMKILGQRKVERFLLFPDLVHKVPIKGFCKAEFEILDLEKRFEDFDLIIQGLDSSLYGKKSLLFYFKVEWVIREDKPFVWEEENNIPKIYKKVLAAIKENKLPQVLCEYIEGIICDRLCRIQEGHLEVPPAFKFSEFVFKQIVESLAREESFSTLPFISISLKNFQVALRTEAIELI